MSVLGDEQNQQVSNGSVAVQVRGDLNYSGLSYTDVKSICTDLFEANFPKLREEAKQISMRFIDDFSVIFFERLEKERRQLENIQERLASPDVQAAINTSVLHVARMTNKSHQEILCELLVEKINEIEDEKNLLLNESIEVIEKISKNQALFLIMIYLLRDVYPVRIIEGVEEVDHDKERQYDYYENLIPTLIGDDIYEIDTFLLLHKGLIRSGQFYNTPLNKLLSQKTSIDLSVYENHSKIEDGDEFNIKFPRLSNIIKKFGFNDLSKFDALPLSPIAQEIAIAYLRNKKIL